MMQCFAGLQCPMKSGANHSFILNTFRKQKNCYEKTRFPDEGGCFYY
jgi:hypothetical protein